MRRLVAFLRLARPHFLAGGVAGVALGAAVAHRDGARIDAADYLWAQLLVTAFQLMVHFANDYFDREGDAGAVRTAWSGGSGVLVAGALPAAAALVAAAACAAAGLGGIARFALAGNPAAALLGAAILAGSWIYSAPPLRLAARGLGELDAALVVGVLVPAVAYAAFAGGVGPALLLAAAPCAAAMFLMMLAVELPDAACDAAAGKRNLVVRLQLASPLPAARVAFAGVALYALTTAGLAAAFALAR